MNTLVIGYGNPLRRDDGLGLAVADRFRGRPGVMVVTCHQLTPELAEPLAGCDRAVFVDAAAEPLLHAVECRVIEPTARPASLGHAGDPGWLLGLAEAVFGRRPAGWLVRVPAADLGFGDGLSAAGERQAGAAAAAVEAILRGEPCTNSG